MRYSQRSMAVKQIKPLLSFLGVGLAAFGIYFLLLTMLLELFAADYRWAVTLAYIPGVIFSFYANKYLTFQSRNRADTRRQLMRYGIVNLGNYFLTMLIVMVVVEWFHYAPYVGAVLATMVNAVVGYVFSRYWIFTHQSDCATPPEHVACLLRRRADRRG